MVAGEIGVPLARLRVITGTDPAAGAEITETVPASRRWLLLGIRIGLTTSATAANRYVTLWLDNGTNVFYKSLCSVIQTASLTKDYIFVASSKADETAFDAVGVIRQSIPRCVLDGGYRIRTNTANLVTGAPADDFAAPILYVLEVQF